MTKFERSLLYATFLIALVGGAVCLHAAHVIHPDTQHNMSENVRLEGRLNEVSKTIAKELMALDAKVEKRR